VTGCLAALRLDRRFIVFAPLQPLIGAASLVLLAGTLAWRFRLRARRSLLGLIPGPAGAILDAAAYKGMGLSGPRLTDASPKAR
jgi:hypothetical protein